ncbi:hypothetical protein Hanom_Chr15g01378531 [Helianthus anomalus]
MCFSLDFLVHDNQTWALSHTVAKLEIYDRGAEVTGPKHFYKTGGSKTYIPKNFYAKTTYSPLLSEKFGGSAVPSHPLKASPMHMVINHRSLLHVFSCGKFHRHYDNLSRIQF